MLSVTYAECHIQALYDECYYAECLYSECRYKECRGAISLTKSEMSYFINPQQREIFLKK
jgi:hypothetical protein